MAPCFYNFNSAPFGQCLRKPGRNERFLCNQQLSHFTDECSLEKWSAHPVVKEITTKIVALKICRNDASKTVDFSSWILDNYLCQSAICHTLPIQMVAELILGDQKEKRTRKRQSHDDKRHLLEGPLPRQKWPRAYKPSSLHMLWRELKHFATKEPFGVLKSHHVLDACMHIHTLKFLVEAAC